MVDRALELFVVFLLDWLGLGSMALPQLSNLILQFLELLVQVLDFLLFIQDHHLHLLDVLMS